MSVEGLVGLGSDDVMMDSCVSYDYPKEQRRERELSIQIAIGCKSDLGFGVWGLGLGLSCGKKDFEVSPSSKERIVWDVGF